MERLTMWYDGNHAICQNEDCDRPDCPFADPVCKRVQDIIDRLAAYEDTGLEPGEIKRAFNEDAVLKLAGQVLGIEPDRLRKLKQADDEGRCVVFQPGYAVVSVYNPADEDGLYTQSVTGVISKEEYESTLEGMKNG